MVNSNRVNPKIMVNQQSREHEKTVKLISTKAKPHYRARLNLKMVK